jgi:uncharacterized protein YebE (UPF0316 family)
MGGPWGPLVIFCLRIGDVSLTTVRTILILRGQKILVPVIAVFETLIWVTAIGSALSHMNSPLHVAGYVLGFASGNVAGMWLEEKLAVGLVSAHVFSRTAGPAVAKALRGAGFGATELTGTGRDGTVTIVFSVARRRDLPRLMETAHAADAAAFVTVEEARTTGSGRVFSALRK